MPAATAQAPEPAKTEDIAQMTGRELMQALIDGRLPPPSIAQTLSFRIVEVGDGRAVFEGETGAHLLNPLGGVHGGWALTLIDSATGCAAHSTLPAGFGIATIETKANFTRADQQEYRTRARRGACRRSRPPDHFCRSAGDGFDRPRPRPRHVDGHGRQLEGRRLIGA